MPDIKNIEIDSVLYDLKDETARTNIGDLSALKTQKKSDTVSAINEIYDMANSNDGGGLPSVSTGDNGKILQVVDGAWTVVAIADSEVKKYIDDYINSALEGEY